MLDVLMYSYDLSQAEYTHDHPFKPIRAKLLRELLNRYFLIFETNQKVVEPMLLEEELLYLFHTREYVDLLKKAEEGEFTIDTLHAGLGTDDNPVFDSMYKLALQAAGGTYQGAQMLLRDEARFVFNPVGGFHHAGSDHAEGFCYINDIAVTIADLVRKGKRIACIDIDAHHGNGVQDAFYETDRVLTVSLHESGETLYPGTGYETEIGTGPGAGYNVNVPLKSGTDDEVYLYAFESVVPPIVKSYNPDITFAIIGCDSHRNDPLAHLNLTSNGYKAAISSIRDTSSKIIALGAGGYNIFKTAALWTLAWATFCGLTPVDQTAGVVGGMMYGPEVSSGQLDDEPFVLSGAEKDLCYIQAGKVVEYLKQVIFPVHGLR
jgi:acetoin utilization protein AcuC